MGADQAVSCGAPQTSPRRVAVVTTSYPRAPGDAAGHFVRSAALEWVARGHRVEVIAAGTAAEPGPDSADRLRVHWVGGGQLFGWPGAWTRLARGPWRAFGALSFARGARCTLRRLGRFDVAEVHWLVPTAWPLLGALDTPTVVVMHGADIRLLARMPRQLSHAVLRSVLTRNVHLRFVAHCLRERLLSLLEPTLAAAVAQRSEVRPCPLGLPSELLVSSRHRPPHQAQAATAEPVVAVVGRLVRGKRVDLALEAIAQLPRSPTVWVVGDGPDTPRLTAMARALGVHATFRGRQPRPVALRWLAAADVLLHCSAHEAAPTVVREARALGVSVVATPAGDLGRWARHDDGLSLAAPRAPALAAALMRQLGASSRYR